MFFRRLFQTVELTLNRMLNEENSCIQAKQQKKPNARKCQKMQRKLGQMTISHGKLSFCKYFTQHFLFRYMRFRDSNHFNFFNVSNNESIKVPWKLPICNLRKSTKLEIIQFDFVDYQTFSKTRLKKFSPRPRGKSVIGKI